MDVANPETAACQTVGQSIPDALALGAHCSFRFIPTRESPSEVPRNGSHCPVVAQFELHHYPLACLVMSHRQIVRSCLLLNLGQL